MPSGKFITVVSVLLVAVSHAGEAPGNAPAEPVTAPLVEIEPRTGTPYKGHLLSCQSGVLEFELETGERKLEQADALLRVRFLSTPVGALKEPQTRTTGEPNPPLKHALAKGLTGHHYAGGEWMQAIRQQGLNAFILDHQHLLSHAKNAEAAILSLAALSVAGTMSAEEVEKKVAADRAWISDPAVLEKVGHLDEIIERQQQKLQDGSNVEEAKHALRVLWAVYYQQGLSLEQIGEKLRRTVEGIRDAGVRDNLQDLRRKSDLKDDARETR